MKNKISKQDMREIEFRGYCVKGAKDNYQQWITDGCGVYEIKYPNGVREYTNLIRSVHLLTPYGQYIVAKDSIGQYTGIKDKDGKKVYERDIIKDIKGNIYEVVWYKSGFKARYTGRNTKTRYFDLYEINCKVIGNTYEEPELLDITKTSIFISLVLRHKPQEANLTLDEFGYANVSELLKGMGDKGYTITMQDLERIVKEDDKQRYSFNNDKTKIRANQGHSIKVNLKLQPIEPPEYLYHGTFINFSNSIIKKGITKQKRQYVHLSDNMETATKVGKRHGECVVFMIDSKEMYENGYKFYLSENNVWLTDYVPKEYIFSNYNKERRNVNMKNYEFGMDYIDDLKHLYGENYYHLNGIREDLFKNLQDEQPEIKALRNIIQNPMPISQKQFEEWIITKDNLYSKININSTTKINIESISDFIKRYHLKGEEC